MIFVFAVEVSRSSNKDDGVGTGCRVEMTTQQSNNNTIYFCCSVVQCVVLEVISGSKFFCRWYRASNIHTLNLQPTKQPKF